MKKNYYELQVYVAKKGYLTILSYSGLRSNANRKFRMYLDSFFPNYQAFVFRVLTYSSVESMINGDSSLRSLPFNP